MLETLLSLRLPRRGQAQTDEPDPRQTAFWFIFFIFLSIGLYSLHLFDILPNWIAWMFTSNFKWLLFVAFAILTGWLISIPFLVLFSTTTITFLAWQGIVSAWIGLAVSLLGILLLLAFSRAFHQQRLDLMWMLYALFVHVYVVARDFNLYVIFIAGGLLVLPLILYMFPGLRANQARNQPVQALIAFVASLLAYALPYFSEAYLVPLLARAFKFTSNWQIAEGITFFITICPIFFLYIMWQGIAHSHGENGLAGVRFFYIFLIIAAIIFPLLFNWALELPAVIDRIAPGSLSGQVDSEGHVTIFGGKIKELIETKIIRRAKQLEEQAKNPGEYYTGRVEDNKRKPVGVKLTDVRAIDNDIDTETSARIYGNVYAQAFLGPKLSVLPSCIIDKKGMPGAAVDPVQLDVIFGTSGTFECVFPPFEKRGTYLVDVGITFPFQTQADVPFTLVSKQKAEDLASQGLLVHEILDIEQYPASIYTAGPVIMGMGGKASTPQPITIDADGEDILEPGTRVGVTLDKDWEGGEINQIYKIEFKVPRPFALDEESCDREVSTAYQSIDNQEYTIYEFENVGLSTVLSYTSLTCKLIVPEEYKEEARALVLGEKATRSFLSVAHYEYTISEKVTVRVR
ncbi:MAG: hypothetical protein OXR66_06350 [Candidatus Woesearchaeota archaeon]|nr:hypothetical protein [Candidatus Woesearchaeota archaeon]